MWGKDDTLLYKERDKGRGERGHSTMPNDYVRKKKRVT